MLIGLTGKRQTGKDTIGRILCDKYNFSRAAVADPIRHAVGDAFGLSMEYMADSANRDTPVGHLNGRTYRELVNEMGRLGREFVDHEVWLRMMALRINGHLAICAEKNIDVPGVVITDIRFEREAAWIREEGGWVVHVIRQTGIQDDIPGLMFQQNDKQILNDASPSDLVHKVDTLLRHLARERPSGIVLPPGAVVH